MNAVTLVFPFQLFDPHPAMARDRAVALIEDSLIFGDPHHPLKFQQQKMVLHRASMKTYAAKLERRGYRVIYRDFQKDKTAATHLRALQREGFDEFHYCQPVDFILEKRLRTFFESHRVKAVAHDTPMFLTPGDWMDAHFAKRKRPFMAAFYEAQRLRLGVLVDQNRKPVGGRWSFDDENRKPMPKQGLRVPPDPAAQQTAYVREAIDYTKRHFPGYHGDAAAFRYPVSHESADRWFEDFLEQRFAQFGPYEDAISRRERVLFHSVLTPMLNLGLLTPQGVLDRALAFAAENDVPLASLEGFVRQIIGWREFMRAMYERHGLETRNGNHWGFDDKPIPKAFYDGSTGIPPVDDAIRRALDHGWCHHIERLMILGNFMLLCRFHPRRVYDWFMELFVDAYDWVMVPNVFGMSQFADGGLFTTKPYLSGSNYVRKMSDYPSGDWCATWDGLFWSFIDDYRDFFLSQHRLSMMARNLDKMGAEKRRAHRVAAESFWERLA